MRDGGAVADARGAEPLALQQHVEHGALGLAGELGGALGQFLQRLALVGGAQIGDDAVGLKDIDDVHQEALPLSARRETAPRSGSIQPTLPSRRR